MFGPNKKIITYSYRTLYVSYVIVFNVR